MSEVVLHPDIDKLDPGSLTYTIYKQLYRSFFDAQEKKSEDNPYGIVEGDNTSIRLHNTAYSFASAVAGGVTGDGNGSGNQTGVLSDYLKLSGGTLYGPLQSNCGFEAGVDNKSMLRVSDEGVKITGDLLIGGDNLVMGGQRFLSYDTKNGIVSLSGKTVDFSTSSLISSGTFLFGKDKQTGISISSSSISVKGKEVFHQGNANLSNMDWQMKKGTVHGQLLVSGSASFSGAFSALYGSDLGYNNSSYIRIDKAGVMFNRSVSFAAECGIEMNGVSVFSPVNTKDIQVGASGGDLLLGTSTTKKIRNICGISDLHGEHLLVSRYGAAYFPDSLTVRHNFNDVVFSSYHTDKTDEGVYIHKRLRFGEKEQGFLYGKNDGICFGSAVVRYVAGETPNTYHYESLLSYGASTSNWQPLNRFSGSLFVDTNADYIVFSKPVEVKEYIGIDGSFTRLSNNQLYFTKENFLLSTEQGVKHYGNSFFLSDVSSEFFSSGFGGSGWAIHQNKATGSYTGTFDELTVRKKMRIYELEIQKQNVTNGSFWVSDSCKGDQVIKL